MTTLDLLKRLAGEPIFKLISILEAVGAAVPDLADDAAAIIVKLNQAIPVSNLVSVAEALPSEIANIAQGKFDPRDHPSDAA